MSLGFLAHTSITQRAHHVLYNLLAVRFTGVLLRPAAPPGAWPRWSWRIALTDSRVVGPEVAP